MEMTALSVIVGILAVIQGWQLINARRKHNNNPTGQKLDGIIEKLDIIKGQLGRVEMRLNDIWDRVKED